MTICNGRIFWRGQSMLADEPIVAVLTGFTRQSENDKTGDMLQLWILPENMSPVVARQTGQDACVCGDCAIKAECYVKWHQAPQSVWLALKRGSYPDFCFDVDGPLLADRSVRLGACGDPVAIPYRLTKRLARACSGHTGYTHQWRRRQFWRWQSLLMASVESYSDSIEAQRMGWRTFRIGGPKATPDRPHEIRCPASIEAGKLTTCERCQLCAGAGRKGPNVLIQAHGARGQKLANRLAII